MRVKDFRPPGPFLQKINSLIHQEPLGSILYAVYWSVIIGVFSPIAILLLQLRLLYRFLTWIFTRRTAACDPQQHPTRELAIIVTGCDSGFGRNVAVRAADAGFIVFAGCLKEESVTEWKEHGTIQPFVMNVTDDKHIEEAFQIVSKWLDGQTTTKQRVLHALINMAGVGFCGNVDFMPLALFQTSMDGK